MPANAGEVVLAAPLFYEGNCVIINHGQQFLTIYMHLSKLSVKEGDKVEKGQEVGLVRSNRPRYRTASSCGRAMAGRLSRSRAAVGAAVAESAAGKRHCRQHSNSAGLVDSAIESVAYLVGRFPCGVTFGFRAADRRFLRGSSAASIFWS